MMLLCNCVGSHTLFSAEYSNSFGLLLHCLDDPVEKLLVFRITGEGSNAGGAEAKSQVVQQLAKLMADSIFSTDPVCYIPL